MQCFRRCLLILLLLAAGGGAAVFAAAFFLADWLNDPDAPQRSDAIVVLADDPARAAQAADLYRQGYGARIYVTVPKLRASQKLLAQLDIPYPRSEELFRAVLERRGVPAAAIRTVGRDLVSTFAEAEAVRTELPDARSLLVVTSPYHVRRTRIIFRDALPARELRVVATRYEPYPTRWWTDGETAQKVVLEVAKLAFYELGGRFR